MAGIGGQVVKSIPTSMFSRNSCSVLRRLRYNLISKNVKYSTTTQNAGEKDPAPLFFNEEVQDLLHTLTRPSNSKLFRTRKDGKRITDPEYRFMTDEELEQALKDADQRGKRRLSMPPVLKKRKEIDSVLSKDPELQGYDTATYLFTDISYGVNNHERLIVAREPNGILRHAKWDERHRLNQIYNPMEGREMVTPRMFQEEFLQDLLERQEYEYVLNRACVQYEPNDPEYIRVTETVYHTVNREKHFDHLRSTRHYGPLVFHLAWTRNIDNLLLENITTDKLEDAVLAIKLYNKIHTDAKSVGIQHNGDDVEFIREFISLEAAMKGKLEVAIQALKEMRATKEAVSEGVEKAHGL